MDDNTSGKVSDAEVMHKAPEGVIPVTTSATTVTQSTPADNTINALATSRSTVNTVLTTTTTSAVYKPTPTYPAMHIPVTHLIGPGPSSSAMGTQMIHQMQTSYPDLYQGNIMMQRNPMQAQLEGINRTLMQMSTTPNSITS